MSDAQCTCGCGQVIPERELFRYRPPYLLRGHREADRICACGCDKPIPWTPRLRYRPTQFIRGHGQKTPHPTEVKLCVCGCEQPIPITRYGRKSTRYLKSHALRKHAEPQRCACGCGELASVVEGRASRFVHGHNRRGVRNPHTEGRHITGDGYVMLRMPEHPQAHKGYIQEHRYVAGQMLGRLLRPHETVHHRNENRSDNRPENLEVMSRAEHTRLHRPHGPGWPKGKPRSDEDRRKVSEGVRRALSEGRGRQRKVPFS